MSMLFGKVTIPDTSGDMTVKAIPVASIGGVTAESINVSSDETKKRWEMTGYTTMTSLVGVAWIYCVPDADPNNVATWPTAQQVVDNGMPSYPAKVVDGELVMYPLPFYLQDLAGSPFPDARLYFVAKSDGAGELRVGS